MSNTPARTYIKIATPAPPPIIKISIRSLLALSFIKIQHTLLKNTKKYKQHAFIWWLAFLCYSKVDLLVKTIITFETTKDSQALSFLCNLKHVNLQQGKIIWNRSYLRSKHYLKKEKMFSQTFQLSWQLKCHFPHKPTTLCFNDKCVLKKAAAVEAGSWCLIWSCSNVRLFSKLLHSADRGSLEGTAKFLRHSQNTEAFSAVAECCRTVVRNGVWNQATLLLQISTILWSKW
jgi:hypothetical protein